MEKLEDTTQQTLKMKISQGQITVTQKMRGLIEVKTVIRKMRTSQFTMPPTLRMRTL